MISRQTIDLGKIKWIREESLADIAAIEMVDLPLSDSEGAIEKQLKSDNGMLCLNYLINVVRIYLKFLLIVFHIFCHC